MIPEPDPLTTSRVTRAPGGVLERAFERTLWSSRLVVLVAVVASLLVSLLMFWVATVDAVHLAGLTGPYHLAHGPERVSLRSEVVAGVVEVVDGYLLAAIMLIFSLGLYELFVSRIDVAEGSEFAQRVLLIRSLDDLKDRLAKVVILILVVKFFEFALHLEFKTPADLVLLALGVLLLAGALWLTHGKGQNGHA